MAFAARRSRSLPKRVNPRDIVLFGIATHRITRIVSRDRIAIPLRAALTEYKGTDGAGQVKEQHVCSRACLRWRLSPTTCIEAMRVHASGRSSNSESAVPDLLIYPHREPTDCRTSGPLAPPQI
jgi:hypothetical protein